MNSLGLIYIRKVFSLFIYVTPERRYCDIRSEREIFYLRNVVIIIIIVVAWLAVKKCTVCVFDVRWHIDRRIKRHGSVSRQVYYICIVSIALRDGILRCKVSIWVNLRNVVVVIVINVIALRVMSVCNFCC